jgi:hypothetical protein
MRSLTRARIGVVVIVAVIAMLAGVAASQAARAPTFREREALMLALPAWIRHYPVGCVWLDVSISNNGRYAKVAPGFLNATHLPCLRYASNGYWLLKKTTRWKIVFNGSVDPPCALAIPRDLSGCHP